MLFFFLNIILLVIKKKKKILSVSFTFVVFLFLFSFFSLNESKSVPPGYCRQAVVINFFSEGSSLQSETCRDFLQLVPFWGGGGVTDLPLV